MKNVVEVFFEMILLRRNKSVLYCIEIEQAKHLEHHQYRYVLLVIKGST